MTEHKKSRQRLTHLERHAVCVVLDDFLSLHDARSARDTLDLASDGEAAIILASIASARVKLRLEAPAAATQESR